MTSDLELIHCVIWWFLWLVKCSTICTMLQDIFDFQNDIMQNIISVCRRNEVEILRFCRNAIKRFWTIVRWAIGKLVMARKTTYSFRTVDGGNHHQYLQTILVSQLVLGEQDWVTRFSAWSWSCWVVMCRVSRWGGQLRNFHNICVLLEFSSE